ncbi:MAG: hypothetical protein EZS28_023092 [Streblomastix strix]|uniref:Protein kinase domain-containing protein n=1 Tax=Streblomastix strix TaxID=222440 RepID=A0A5J4VFX1_9EUKA|nr:MAG: hypothetical protein EZS28_023092 [Streblomastix strix]
MRVEKPFNVVAVNLKETLYNRLHIRKHNKHDPIRLINTNHPILGEVSSYRIIFDQQENICLYTAVGKGSKDMGQSGDFDEQNTNVIGGGYDALRWRAPEMQDGAPPSSETAAFSLGLVLWEMLTYEVPLGKLDANIAMRRIYGKARPSLADMPEQAISDLIEKLWSHKPDKRPSLVELQEISRDISPFLLKDLTQKESERDGDGGDYDDF